jgi:hypothetical protein
VKVQRHPPRRIPWPAIRQPRDVRDSQLIRLRHATIIRPRHATHHPPARNPVLARLPSAMAVHYLPEFHDQIRIS